MNDKECEVKDCPGHYIKKIISYCNLRKVRTPEYDISVEQYNNLKNKEGYIAVVSHKCNICDDDLDNRLIEFCKTLDVWSK